MFGKFVLLFIVWVGLTNSLDWQELIVGALLAFGVVAIFSSRDENVNVFRLAIKYIRFAPIFLVTLVKSNIEVAKIVIRPKIEIKPGIVKFKTELTSDYDRLLLSNSITLTPGTITIEQLDDTLYIHFLDIQPDVERETLRKNSIAILENSLIK